MLCAILRQITLLWLVSTHASASCDKTLSDEKFNTAPRDFFDALQAVVHKLPSSILFSAERPTSVFNCDAIIRDYLDLIS